MLRQVVQNGDVDGAIKKLSQQVARNGLLSGLKDKKFYESRNKKKKRKAAENRKKSNKTKRSTFSAPKFSAPKPGNKPAGSQETTSNSTN